MIFYKFVSFYLKIFSRSVASWNIHFCSIFLEVVLMYNQLDIEEQSSLKKLSLSTNACQQNIGKIKRNKQQSLKKTCPPITSKKYILSWYLYRNLQFLKIQDPYLSFMFNNGGKNKAAKEGPIHSIFPKHWKFFYQNLFANHSKD